MIIVMNKNSKQRKTEHIQIKTLITLPQSSKIGEAELCQILMTKKCSLVILSQNELLFLKHHLKQLMLKYLQRRREIWNLKIFFSAIAIKTNNRLQNKISLNRMVIFIKINYLLKKKT